MLYYNDIDNEMPPVNIQVHTFSYKQSSHNTCIYFIRRGIIGDVSTSPGEQIKRTGKLP